MLIVFSPAPGDIHTVNVDGEIEIFTKSPARLGTDNVVEFNTIEFPLSQSQAAIPIFDFAYQEGLIIRNNDVTGGAWSVCMDNNGMSPPEYRSRGTMVLDNELKNADLGGVRLTHTMDAVIMGNSITRAKKPTHGAANSNGISIRNVGLENAIVTENTVNGYSIPLDLQAQSAAFFGAEIYRNDFVTDGAGHAGVVGVESHPATYSFPTDLSVGGMGNYWGRTCDDSDGFRDADEKLKGKVDSPNLDVTDSYPYGEPVAGLPGPFPCP